jgi:HEAT repeat protein
MDVLAHDRPPDALAETVRPRQRTRFLSFLSTYATSVRGDELERIRAVARPFLPAIQNKMDARRPTVRAQAVRRISLLGGGDDLPALREALEDPSATVAWMAMMGLAKRGTPDDADLVIQQLDRLSGIDRRQLTSALVELGEDAAPALRTAMASPLIEEKSQSAFTRLICAEALRWLADAAAAPIAVSLLEQDADDPELHASLLRLLRRVGRSRHAPVVRAQCQSEVSFVRIHAARALGQLGAVEDEDLLASLLHGDDARWVALSAMQSLSELGCTGPIRQLAGSSHTRAALAEGFLPHSA